MLSWLQLGLSISKSWEEFHSVSEADLCVFQALQNEILEDTVSYAI